MITCETFCRLNDTETTFINTTRAERAAMAKHYIVCRSCQAWLDGLSKRGRRAGRISKDAQDAERIATEIRAGDMADPEFRAEIETFVREQLGIKGYRL